MHELAARTPLQISTFLKALRGRRGWTQRDLGEAVGLSQARIAEIESNPGVISVNQLLSLLTTLGAAVILRARDTTVVDTSSSVVVSDQVTATITRGPSSRSRKPRDPEGEW